MKNTQTIQYIDGKEKMIFWALIGFLVVMFSSYIYFMQSMAFNSAFNKKLHLQFVQLKSQTSALEKDVLIKEESISLSSATDFGFKQVDARFVSKKSLSSAGSLTAVR